MDSLVFQQALLRKIKPDLNWIYTEPPFNTPTGSDFGWFCREHAMHLYLVARLLGFASTIIRGDVAVRDKKQISATIDINGRSIGEHYWCSVENSTPVDISLTLRHMSDSTEIPIVYGTDNPASAPYRVICVESLVDLNTAIRREMGHVAVYHQVEQIDVQARDLVADPFIFLLRPPKGSRGWAEEFGEEIFAMVTQHCLKLSLNQCKPVHAYLDRTSAIRRIAKWNVGAQERLMDDLQS